MQELSFEKEAAEELMERDGEAMVPIPAGSFSMGSRDGESDEEPVHRVELDGFIWINMR